MVGRRYAGTVQQIITGSIGFDDWEWGVDLFADDPLVFKKLIYEMRFDEVSAVYALFGTFYVGRALPGRAVRRVVQRQITGVRENRRDRRHRAESPPSETKTFETRRKGVTGGRAGHRIIFWVIKIPEIKNGASMDYAINALTVAVFAVILSLSSIVALIMGHIRLRDRIEVLEAILDRLERKSVSAAQTAK